MISTSVVGARSDLRTSGAPSLVQGVYGARGNLELLACDAADGLWVFWFNSDLDTDPLAAQDVPPGSWSAGLQFAQGCCYVEAQILQSTLGPDHLEVLALTDGGVLQSWYWSPEPGFQRRTTDAAAGVAAFAACHRDGTVQVTVRDIDGRVSHRTSSADGYPSRAWLAAGSGPSLDLDARDAVVAAGYPEADILPGTSRCAISSRKGGTAELTWRDRAGNLRHLAVPSTE